MASKNIIKLDKDTIEYDSEFTYPKNLKDFEIGIKEDKFSVAEILRRYQDGRIILDESFQRNLVWDKKQMSKFIESIILDLPIPALFFNQTIDGKFIVVDGRQRISSLICFLGKIRNKEDGELSEYLNFKLNGLKGLAFLNGKNFKDLKEEIGLQARIEDKNFNIFIIKPSVKMPIIYDIFDRINTGGTKLNKQEVRNALLAGESTKLIKRLCQTDYFKKATNEGISDKRMKDQETVLRILSFLIFDYQADYKGNISEFLEDSMRKINKMYSDEINKLEYQFERIMTKSFELFGVSNFRLSSEKGHSPINLAVIDSICHFISNTSDEFLNKNKEKINMNYQTLLQNQTYLDAVSLATSTKEKVITRFDMAKEILSKI